MRHALASAPFTFIKGKIMTVKSKISMLVTLMFVSTGAHALSFDFAKLHAPNLGTDTLPINTYFSCTGNDICSADHDKSNVGGSLVYSTGGVSVTATGFYKGNLATVVQDSENAYNAANKIGAGLGVYHLFKDTSDDNITTGESLTIVFDEVVNLTGISLRSEGHNVTGWKSGSTFLFNGTDTGLAGDIALDLVGTTFTFAYGGSKADQFYLSGLTFETLIPEPSSYALMLAGLSMLAFASRRSAK